MACLLVFWNHLLGWDDNPLLVCASVVIPLQYLSPVLHISFADIENLACVCPNLVGFFGPLSLGHLHNVEVAASMLSRITLYFCSILFLVLKNTDPFVERSYNES